MLTGGTDALYRQILANGGARFLRRLEVWRSGTRYDTYGDAGVPFTGGSLTANLENRVTRQLRLSLDTALFPSRSGHLLDPLQDELVLWCGWQAGAATPYLWRVFTGPVTGVDVQSRASTFSLEASDRVEQIVEDRFTSPVASGAGVLVTTRIKDLISDSQPGAVFGTFDPVYTVTPEVTWEADRAQALDDLATAAGCLWYQLPDGSYTLRLIPWAQATLGTSLLTLVDGEDLTKVTLKRTRVGVYNICQVSGEAANGDPPVSGTASDDDPTSPTFVNGPLGARVLKVRSDAVTSVSQAESVARQRLRRSRVHADEISSTSTFDPALELGDVATIVTQFGTYQRAVSSFTANLTSMPTMSIQWRAAGEATEE